MANSIISKITLFSALGVISSCSAQSELDYVDPLVGTMAWQSEVAVAGHEAPSGFTFPGVTVPFGMTEWTPHTLESRNPIHKNTNRVPYWHDHSLISGFIGTHYPSGAVMYDYGAVELMPQTGDLKYRLEDRASAYSHEKEQASPDYYKVRLEDYGVDVEITASHTSSVMKFTFPESDSARILVDAMPTPFTAGVPSELIIDPEKSEIRGKSAMSARGYRESGYFVVKFDKKFESYGTFNLNATYPEVIEEKYLFTEKDGKRVNGLSAVYTQESPVYGHLEHHRIDPAIDFNWDWYKPGDDFEFSDFQSLWTGTLVPPVSGDYVLGLQSDDGSRLYLDGLLVVDNWDSRDFTFEPKQSTVCLEAGREYDIRVEHFQGGGGAKMKLSWIIPADESVAEVLAGNGRISGSSKMGAYVNFRTCEGEVIQAKVGTSFICMEQAEKNLDSEIGDMSFKEVRKRNAGLWENELSRIELPGASEDDKTVFYTALYHSMLLPRSITEAGDVYRSPFNAEVCSGRSYTDYSLWDTFRAVHPLFVLLKPEFSGELVSGLLNAYDEGGWIPKWPNPGYTNCMMGTHGDAVIADAYIKGVDNFDLEKAKEAMLKNAYQKGDYMYWGRLGIKPYDSLGYVPIDFCLESAARTMEFAYDDYCISQFLFKKGDDAEAELLRQRSMNFKNLLDHETKLIRGRKTDGSWAHPEDYNISIWCGYTPQGVSNYKKNYTLFVPHDVPELVDFLGGNEALSSLLDDLFGNGIYYVGDEFSMHAPYMYNCCGMPWKTQRQVREIVGKYYLPQPGGLPGNDDCGQLSAWYLFSSLGFYPMCPGSDEYQIGSPAFPEAIIKLENGGKLHIKADNWSEDNVYVQSFKLNGKPWHSSVLHHGDICNGALLEFDMGPEPQTMWFE